MFYFVLFLPKNLRGWEKDLADDKVVYIIWKYVLKTFTTGGFNFDE